MDVVGAIGWEVLDRFRVGTEFALSPHGIGIALGYLAGSYVFMYEGTRRGISEEHSGTLVLWALVGAIVGARFFYVLAHWGEPGLQSLGDAIAVWRGGISLIGGIFGATFFAYPSLRRFKVGFLRVMDPAVIGLGIGIVIGRVGDLIIGDHLGKPTSWLLAFVYHGGQLSGYECTGGVCRTGLFGGQTQIVTADQATLLGREGEILAQGVGIHQTALYDFVSTMVLVLVLLWLGRRAHRAGVLAMTFAIWYGSVRIVTDFLRVDKRFFGLTGSQWASVLVIALSLATVVWWRLGARRRRASEVGPTDGDEAASDDEVGDDEAAASGAGDEVGASEATAPATPSSENAESSPA